MDRYDFTVKPIENGWIFVSELPGKPGVTLFFKTELEALIALKLAIDLAIELTAKEK